MSGRIPRIARQPRPDRAPTRSRRSRREVAFRRRSSGSWAAVPAPEPSPAMETRSAADVYAEACQAARMHLAEGRAEEAARAARAARGALEALPRGMEAQRLLGLALLESGEPRPAAHAFGAALNADPLDAVALTGLAEAQEQLEGAGAAESFWRRAWEGEPGLPSVGERYQTSRRAAGDLNVQAGPPPLTRAALARIHLRGGLFEHAAGEARAVLAREPDRADVRLTMAEAFWRSGDGEAAAAVAADVLERTPDCVAANLLLAAHWAAEGRDAAELIARVQAVDPAGGLAARLFDDREVPSLFGTASAFDQWPATPVAIPPAEEPAPEPALISEVEEVAADAIAAEPEAQLAEPEAPVAEMLEAPVEAHVEEPVEDRVEAPLDERFEEAADEDQAPAVVAPDLADTRPLEPVVAEPEESVMAQPDEPELAEAELEAAEPEVREPEAAVPAAFAETDDEDEVIQPVFAFEQDEAAEAAEASLAPSAMPDVDEIDAVLGREDAPERGPIEAAVEAATEQVVEASSVTIEEPSPAAPAAAPEVAEVASGGAGREAGDELMRRGDYLGALREYGAVLRALREQRGEEAAGQR